MAENERVFQVKRFPVDLHIRLKKLAAGRQTSMTKVLAEVIRRGLEVVEGRGE